jgi:hypothetical protein
MTTLAAALLAGTPDPCPDLLCLASHLVQLWGACFVALTMVGPGSRGACAWGLAAAPHMQRLLQVLCTWPEPVLDEELHDTDAALLAVVMVWFSNCHPGRQAVPAPQLEGINTGTQQQQQQQLGAAALPEQQLIDLCISDSISDRDPQAPAATLEAAQLGQGAAEQAEAGQVGEGHSDEGGDMGELAAGPALERRQVRRVCPTAEAAPTQLVVCSSSLSTATRAAGCHPARDGVHVLQALPRVVAEGLVLPHPCQSTCRLAVRMQAAHQGALSVLYMHA